MSRNRRRRKSDTALLLVKINFRSTAFGAWLADIESAGQSVRQQVQAADPHEALHAVLQRLQELADEVNRDLAAIHMLNGDPAAWAELAAMNGFEHCVAHAGHGGAFLAGPGHS